MLAIEERNDSGDEKRKQWLITPVLIIAAQAVTKIDFSPS